MAYNQYILICGGTGCESSKADDIYNNILAELEKAGVKNDVQVVKTGCFGFCEKGPIVKVLPDEAFYVEVKPEDAQEIVQEHIVKGRAVERLLYKEDSRPSMLRSTISAFIRSNSELSYATVGSSTRRTSRSTSLAMGMWRWKRRLPR